MKKHHLFHATVILCCYLGVHQGHLALWKQPGLQPERVFPYSIGLFPIKDQTALEKGIPFSSPSELTGLLEDYLS